jgi:hypothetical protein
MDVNLTGKVGKGLNSSPADLIKIQSLLAAVGVYKMPNPLVAMPAPSQAPVKCPDDVVDAITTFQEFWGHSDGQVWPGGTTLHRLNKVAHPLHLHAITRKTGQTGIKNGGYQIQFSGELPPEGYSLLLHVDVMPPPVALGQPLSDDDQACCLDLTDRAKHHRSDLMDAEKLKALLKIFDEQELWAVRALAVLVVEREGKVVSLSNAQGIDCPIQPYSGKLKDHLDDAKLGEVDAPPLLYTGDADGGGGGAIAYIPAIDGKYYFYYKDGFEIKNTRRGFDCTTFIGAVLDIEGNSGAMGSNGTHFASYLVQQGIACACDLDQATEEELQDFFEEHDKGSYFGWSGSHTVIIKDAVVYEFNIGNSGNPAGFQQTDVADRTFKGSWSLRKLTPSL